MPFLERSAATVAKVEIAFDSNFSTPEGSRTWSDVTKDVDARIGASINYGRDDERSQPSPNSLTLTLNNDAGQYTPGLTTSPHFPNVKKDKPIRVSVVYAGVTYVRFTGYVDEWSVTWPNGGSLMSQVAITAVSRRARLSATAPLTSAIRAAYLATGPDTYWTMSDPVDLADGRRVFLDVTNTLVAQKATQAIGSFAVNNALNPVDLDPTSPGPTDEGDMVKLVPQSSFNFFDHYVGAGNAIRVPTTGGVTVEVVARIRGASAARQSVLYIFGVWTVDQQQGLEWVIASDGTGRAADTGGGVTPTYVDQTTGTIVGSDVANLYNSAAFATATDGELHHYALTLSGGNTFKAYLDGVLIRTGTLNSPWLYTQPFTNIAFGHLTYQATLWVSQGAVHKRALSGAEVLAHAAAATAVTETAEERVVRVAGRIGVPAAEIDTEATIAGSLGSQPEAGRSATDVLDELAVSTAGILYDTRTGHLAMQARNHRYNATSAVTLAATADEVEVDLTLVLDGQFLVNSVDLTRIGSDAPTTTLTDQASISDYGVYTKSLQIASASDEEVVAAGQDQLYRYAQPQTRIGRVSVDISDLKDDQRGRVLNADIGTMATLTGLPPQAQASSLPLFIEGYTETIGIDGHLITFNTTPGDVYQNVFVWDDPVRGKWDSSNVWAY